jgi:sporulation protein YlmC with PRC-barrel domain
MNGKANVVRMGWLTLALVPLLIGIAGAVNLNPSHTDQQTNQTINPNQPSPLSDQMSASRPLLERADNLIGAKVVNERGEQLGTIEDIVLTPDRSGINYAVLSHGWSWGGGGKLFAVPWSQFQVRPGERVLVLSNVTAADLDRAEGFDRAHWPATAQENWLNLPGRATMPPALGYVPPSGNMPYDVKDLRVSELTGKVIRDLQGERLGRLDDVVIDTHQGRIAFGMVAMRTGFLGLSKDYAAVPWPAFQFPEGAAVIRLDTTPETLASVAFKGDSFPDLADPQYSRQLYERFGVAPYGQTLGFVPGREMEHGGPAAGLYNPQAVQTFRGTIENVGTYPLTGMAGQGVLLNIRTQDGRTLSVQAGPRPYVEKQHFTFRQGDEVTITGSPVMVAGQNVIVASQIKLGDKTLNLLTKEGKPLWKADEFESAKESPNARQLDESRAPAYNNY